jgi:hypothetical protein
MSHYKTCLLSNQIPSQYETTMLPPTHKKLLTSNALFFHNW